MLFASRFTLHASMLFRVNISGESMWPYLVSGKSYWATSPSRIKVGDFIIFSSYVLEGRKYFVKQVKKITPEGYVVSGKVSWGSTFGIISKNAIRGKILFFRHRMSKELRRPLSRAFKARP